MVPFYLTSTISHKRPLDFSLKLCEFFRHVSFRKNMTLHTRLLGKGTPMKNSICLFFKNIFLEMNEFCAFV